MTGDRPRLSDIEANPYPIQAQHHVALMEAVRAVLDLCTAMERNGYNVAFTDEIKARITEHIDI